MLEIINNLYILSRYKLIYFCDNEGGFFIMGRKPGYGNLRAVDGRLINMTYGVLKEEGYINARIGEVLLKLIPSRTGPNARSIKTLIQRCSHAKLHGDMEITAELSLYYNWLDSKGITYNNNARLAKCEEYVLMRARQILTED